MASVMKWAGAAAAAALLALPVLLPTSREDTDPAELQELRSERQRVSVELSRANIALYELTVAQTVLASLPDEPGITIELPTDLPDTTLIRWRAELAVEAAAVERPQARTLISVVRNIARSPGERVMPDILYYAGVDSAGPFCAATQNLRADRVGTRDAGLFDAAPHDRIGKPIPALGACYFWARYGAPGARIHDWLRATGYGVAQARADYSEDTPPVRRRGLFGIALRGETSVLRDGCVNGNTEACDALLRSFPPVRRSVQDLSPVAYTPRPWESIGRNERAIFGTLERQFGPERFASFWRSDDDLETAFAASFGIPPGEWMQEWARSRFTAPASSPRMQLADVLLTLLTLGVLTGAALFVAQHRQVR